MNTVRFKLLAVLISILMISTSQANIYHSTVELRQQVSEYAHDKLRQLNYSQFDVQVSSIDSRLRLTPCSKHQLSLFVPHKQSITQASTIGVRCNQQPRDWTIYIPIKIKILTNAVITSHPLPRNYLIRKNDINVILTDIKRSRNGHYSQTKQVIGKLTKRNLRSGAIISPNYLKLPKIISRGERVTITALNKAINVSMKGVALESGQMGEFIRVKNLSSARIIDAKIVARHQVEIKI